MGSSPTETAALTPMLTQYWEIKRRHPDAILFYRMGDFYELFYEDAVIAAPILEVQLTSRDKSSANPVPMCGVPYHAAAQYLPKLLAAGRKVAICEQLEDPSTTKGLVKRDVIRIVTPALVGDPDLVCEETKNLLVAFSESKRGLVEVAVLDLLAGRLRAGFVKDSRELIDLFLELRPKEILASSTLCKEKWFTNLQKYFPGVLCTVRDAYFSEQKIETCISALRSYLNETQKLENLTHYEVEALFVGEEVRLDPVSLKSLEVLESLSQEEGPTLFSRLNRTSTPMGRRLLKDWLAHPSANIKEIEERLGAVETLITDFDLYATTRNWLTPVRDLERLTSKAALLLAMPRDLVGIREILLRIPELKARFKKASDPRIKALGKKLDSVTALTNELQAALEDEPSTTLREGGIFRADYLLEIKELRGLSHDAKTHIAAMEAREKERTGISTLKIKHNKVFGYTIEITKSHLNKVPKEYIRKQTIANAERYITEELRKFEDKVITAEYRLRALEEQLFVKLRAKVAAMAPVLLANARLIAELDVLQSFANAAREFGYVRPTLHTGDKLDIVQGRHPVVEAILPQGGFVPNDLHLDADTCRTLLITGPNMGGKSTIMRQAALIVLMTHAGCFVPASSALIPVTDAIFTRIGSSDDLARGRSTFMVEMSEVARILESATAKSLILIDEIGRGTSTYDGLSLAWSLLEYVHQDVQAKTLFATHFHELTQLESTLPALRNANVLVEKWKDEVVFLYRLAPGACAQSYGIEVAKLAGLPLKVLTRARDLLGLLESQSRRGDRARHRALEIHDNQLGFFDGQPRPESHTGIDN